jgi:hypothetical protein
MIALTYMFAITITSGSADAYTSALAFAPAFAVTVTVAFDAHGTG